MKTLIGLKTIVNNEILRFMRIWPQSLLASALTATLYFVIFGQLAENQAQYLRFITPGLILMAVITNAYGNVAYSVTTHRLQKSLEEIIVSPIPNAIILLGFIIGGVLRGLLVGSIVTVISLFFIDFSLYDPIFFIVVPVLAALLFSLFGFTNAIFAGRYEDVVWVPTFILNPLIYLGGVFFSVSHLPESWQGVAKANPILYLIDSFRYGMMGIAEVDIGWSMAFLVVLIIAIFFINLILINRGVGFTK